MEKVLPLRTAPSQMIASQSPGRHHQVSTLRCFWENRMISAVVPPSFLPGSFRQHPVQLSGPLRLFLAQESVQSLQSPDAALILRGFWIALHARDRFGSLMVVGVMTLVGLQTFLNIGVVTGLLPTTGISLPFFSYGGTALSIQLAEMGIVLSVSRQMKPTKAG